MPISVTCAKCGHTLSVKDKYAGKKGLCPKCQSTILIPGSDDARAAAPAAQRAAGTISKTATVSAADAPTIRAPDAPSARPAARKPATPPKPALSRDEVRERVDAALIGKFEPPKVSLLRKLAMLLHTIWRSGEPFRRGTAVAA